MYSAWLRCTPFYVGQNEKTQALLFTLDRTSLLRYGHFRSFLHHQTRHIAIFTAHCSLVLASASPRRIAFLHGLGIPVTSISPPEEAEPSPLPGEEAATYACRAARSKAMAVFSLLPASSTDATAKGDSAKSAGPDSEPPALVIAADTVVVLDGAILGKPKDAEDAYTMLSSLSGRQHKVITGCVLLCPSLGKERSFAVSSDVLMWDCPKALLRAYASSGEPLDKAGAYAVQGAGAFLVKSLSGSWTNVVGLPLAELVQELLAMDALSPLEAEMNPDCDTL